MEECKAYTVYNPMIFANLIIDYSFTDKNYLTVNKLNKTSLAISHFLTIA